MTKSKSIAMIAAAYLLVLAPAAWSVAAASRFRMRAEVEVNAGVVRLGDLLLEGKAPGLPDLGTVVALAPQPGAELVWPRAQLRRQLQAAGLDPAIFAIPERVIVTRRALPVARRFVLDALAQHFHHRVAAGDIEFSPPLTTAIGDPGIEVVAARLDLGRGGMDVRCRATADPRLLPFMVFMRLPATELALQRRRPLLEAAVAAVAPPELVTPGRLAELSIANHGFALTTAVMPLQAGRAGDTVRAVSLATHAVLQVRVVGRDRVDSVNPMLEASHAFH